MLPVFQHLENDRLDVGHHSDLKGKNIEFRQLQMSSSNRSRKPAKGLHKANRMDNETQII